jgi:SAM-dependent methyltransferase
MERRQKIIGGLDIAAGAGIEIGALAWPHVRKADGDITYVDHVDTITLRQKYAKDKAVPANLIVEVDAVWGARTLRQAIGNERRYDYVIASHVIEHVPDLVGWLCELTEMLKDGGEIRLAVPDRRYTFDHLRNESRFADVLAAYAVKARVPQPQAIFDFLSNYAAVDVCAAWQGNYGNTAPVIDGPVCSNWLKLVRGTIESGAYVDVHCWVFTPRSFAVLMGQVTRSGLLLCKCSRFFDTEAGAYEFFVGLQPTHDRPAALASWQVMADNAAQI